VEEELEMWSASLEARKGKKPEREMRIMILLGEEGFFVTAQSEAMHSITG